MIYEFVEGTSEPVTIQISATPAQSSAGVSIELDIVDRNNEAVSVPPTLSWSSQVNWIVQLDGLENLTVEKSPYYMRIKITDGNARVGYAPTGDSQPDQLKAVRP